MTDQGGHLPDDTPADPERSGATVEEAIDVAARDSDTGGVLRPPERSRSGTAPVEQVAGDPEMTGGQITGAPGTGDGDDPPPPTRPPQEAAVSGGMQSDPGARVSDRLAAQEQEPDAGEPDAEEPPAR